MDTMGFPRPGSNKQGQGLQRPELTAPGRRKYRAKSQPEADRTLLGPTASLRRPRPIAAICGRSPCVAERAENRATVCAEGSWLGTEFDDPPARKLPVQRPCRSVHGI